MKLMYNDTMHTNILKIIMKNEDIPDIFFDIYLSKRITEIAEFIRRKNNISAMDTLNEEIMYPIVKKITEYISETTSKEYKPFISGMGFYFDTKESLLRCCVDDYGRYISYMHKYRLNIDLYPELLQQKVTKIDSIIQKDKRERILRLQSQIEAQI